MTLLITGRDVTMPPFLFITSTTGPTIKSGTVESGTFTLVNRDGNELQEGEFGLLLYNGGTVCNHWSGNSFDNNAANAICHSMG
jgi:hypothetical protein